jgi:hypothetical protein
VDTIVTLVWSDGGKGMYGMPYAADEVTDAIFADFFPDAETIGKWRQGIKARWNPAKARRRKGCCHFVYGYVAFVRGSVLKTVGLTAQRGQRSQNGTDALIDKRV